MAVDTDVYVNPDDFNPTRFLPKPVGNEEPPLTAAFGFGRRSVRSKEKR
jgi:cytochrome P450